jgi:hypothetical protein
MVWSDRRRHPDLSPGVSLGLGRSAGSVCSGSSADSGSSVSSGSSVGSGSSIGSGISLGSGVGVSGGQPAPAGRGSTSLSAGISVFIECVAFGTSAVCIAEMARKSVPLRRKLQREIKLSSNAG